MKKELYERIKKVYYDDFKKENYFATISILVVCGIFLWMSSMNSGLQIFYGAIAIVLFIIDLVFHFISLPKENARKLEMDELLVEVR